MYAYISIHYANAKQTAVIFCFATKLAIYFFFDIFFVWKSCLTIWMVFMVRKYFFYNDNYSYCHICYTDKFSYFFKRRGQKKRTN